MLFHKTPRYFIFAFSLEDRSIRFSKLTEDEIDQVKHLIQRVHRIVQVSDRVCSHEDTVEILLRK